MKGVSEVIAIILILMITISLAGLAYMFMSTTMSDVTSSAGSTVDTTTSSMMTSFTIETMDVAKVYVRNTGQNALTSLSVYVNDEPATYNVTTPIAVGAVGTITIYSFIPDGATVKITSPNGFSTSKVAQPCSKAVGCWKFDEGSGAIAYDSSPSGNVGYFTNNPSWINGKHGSAINLNTSNRCVNISSSISAVNASIGTLSLWFKKDVGSVTAYLLSLSQTNVNNNYFVIGVGPWTSTYSDESLAVNFYNSGTMMIAGYVRKGEQYYIDGKWHNIVWTVGTNFNKIYVDGSEESITYTNGNANTGGYFLNIANADGLFIGNRRLSSVDDILINGIIDEVRIYSRVIY